jgi:hypothetical protein
MKNPLVVLLLLSLAGNAVLAFITLRPPSTVRPASLTAATAPAPGPGSASSGAAPAAAPGPAGTGASANWQALKPDSNMHSLVANLRRAGFPPAVVRAVVSQLVNDRVGYGAVSHLPFWKSNPNNPEYLAAQQELANRRREMLNDLLGAEARPSATLDPATRERRYGQLSDEKVDRIDAIVRDYGELRAKLYAERKPGDFQGTQSAQVAVEEDLIKELATVLTPAELEQYEMRSSQSASRLMGNLKNLDVTEAEYAALFRAQKNYDEADPLRSGVTTQEAMVVRAAAQDELNTQARAVLTDDRFYEYLKGSDANYARLAQFAANHPAITPAMTYELTQIERVYQATMMTLARPGAGGPPSPERMGQLTTARKEYQDKITALLGPETAAAYAQRNRTGIVTTTTTTVPRPGGN